MSERRCLFCQYFDAGIPAENLPAEDDAVARRWGPQVGFGGHCTHPSTPYRLRNQHIETLIPLRTIPAVGKRAKLKLVATAA
jgi:hypothetical protein